MRGGAGEESVSSAIEGLSLLTSAVDNKSIGDDALFCAGDGVPIDRISSNRSVPAFGGGVAPETLQKREEDQT